LKWGGVSRVFGEGQEKGNLPMQSRPMDRIALNAYSIWYRRPSGEKIVMYRSYPPLDILKSGRRELEIDCDGVLGHNVLSSVYNSQPFPATTTTTTHATPPCTSPIDTCCLPLTALHQPNVQGKGNTERPRQTQKETKLDPVVF
jgi:hypothetical protein